MKVVVEGGISVFLFAVVNKVGKKDPFQNHFSFGSAEITLWRLIATPSPACSPAFAHPDFLGLSGEAPQMVSHGGDTESATSGLFMRQRATLLS